VYRSAERNSDIELLKNYRLVTHYTVKYESLILVQTEQGRGRLMHLRHLCTHAGWQSHDKRVLGWYMAKGYEIRLCIFYCVFFISF
jgi:hypothetical protein